MQGTSLEAAGVKIQPLRHGVIFVKEKDIVLTNDAYRFAVNSDTVPYEDAVSKVREDLMIVNNYKTEFTSITELQQIELLLNTMESRLNYFYQLLPKLESRRGIMNLGGTVLKTLFRTATVAHIHQLHQTLDQLKSRNADIVHSLSDQVTYIKGLYLVARVNSEAIANMSALVNDVMIQPHGKFYEVTRDTMWLNLKIHSQSSVYIAVRQLEFAVLQFTQHIDELLTAAQNILQGKLPIALITPTILHNILRNVSLTLP